MPEAKPPKANKPANIGKSGNTPPGCVGLGILSYYVFLLVLFFFLLLYRCIPTTSFTDMHLIPIFLLVFVAFAYYRSCNGYFRFWTISWFYSLSRALFFSILSALCPSLDLLLLECATSWFRHAESNGLILYLGDLQTGRGRGI